MMSPFTFNMSEKKQLIQFVLGREVQVDRPRGSPRDGPSKCTAVGPRHSFGPSCGRAFEHIFFFSVPREKEKFLQLQLPMKHIKYIRMLGSVFS